MEYNVYDSGGQKYMLPAVPNAPSVQGVNNPIMPADIITQILTLTTTSSPAPSIFNQAINNNLEIEQISIQVIQTDVSSPSNVFLYILYGNNQLGGPNNLIETTNVLTRAFDTNRYPVITPGQNISVYGYYSGGSGAKVQIAILAHIAS
jgi:hypothetical protein